MSMQRDAFTWVDTGAVAYPALHKKIIELTMPSLLVKQLFPEFLLVAGKTATFVKEAGSRSAAISEISEGVEIPMDFTPLSYVTVTPYKKGLRERVTRENIEDLYIPVIEQQLRRLARRMAYTIDIDCLNVIGAGAGISSAGTGYSMGATGTRFTLGGAGAYALGQEDILWAKSYIESKSFKPTHIIMNPINAKYVYELPMFSLWAHYGETITKGGVIGTIYDMEVLVTPAQSAGTAYVISSGENPSGAYAPMGFFIIKRPLMSDLEPRKEFDCVDVMLTTRYSPVVLNGDAIVQITGLNTS
jgi:hypothetical protein